MGGRGSSSGISRTRTYSGKLSEQTTHNIGFGEFTREHETAEGKRLFDAVQRASVGTEIAVTSSWNSGFSTYEQEDIYRVTGTTHNKRLIAVNDTAKGMFDVDGITSIPLTDRESLREMLRPSYNNGQVRLQRKNWTASEIAENREAYRQERQARAADRRQYRIRF